MLTTKKKKGTKKSKSTASQTSKALKPGTTVVEMMETVDLLDQESALWGQLVGFLSQYSASTRRAPLRFLELDGQRVVAHPAVVRRVLHVLVERAADTGDRAHRFSAARVRLGA